MRYLFIKFIKFIEQFLFLLFKFKFKLKLKLKFLPAPAVLPAIDRGRCAGLAG